MSPRDQLDLFGPGAAKKPAAPRRKEASKQPPKPPPSDEAGRLAARSEFDAPVILEAGAGTGKTAALVSRVLAWCLGPGWERSRTALENNGEGDIPAEAIAGRTLQRVAAITFTERAAVEMEHKVARGLACLLRGEAVVGYPRAEITLDDEKLRERAGALTTCLDRFNVGTIHAFCRRILATHALEAGLDPAFEVDAEGDQVRSAVDEALGESLQEMYGDPGREEFIQLAAQGIGPKEIAEVVQHLASESIPLDALQQDPYAPERVVRERDRLRAVLAALLPLLSSAFGRGPAGAGKATDTLSALQKLELHLAATEDVEDLVEAVQDPDLLDCMSRLSAWRKGKFIKAELKWLEETEHVTRHAEEIHDWLKSWQKIDPVTLRSACAALHFLLGRVREVLRARGVQTFQDLLYDTRALLAEVESVRRSVRASMDQLLVDEFQDTDPVQCEILRLLALDGEPAQRPGLFLVGDPKQSIYGWRNADLKAYEDFVEAACKIGGQRHFLTVNFRSVPAVLDEVHRLLSPLLHYVPGLQPEYRRLVPSARNQDDPGHVDDTRRPVEHWISWDVAGVGEPERKCGFDTPFDTAREMEADAIARDMAGLAAQGVAWKEMALLLRVSTVQEYYLQAMREQGVPYVVERDRTFYQHREVIDAASLLRAVGDPHDQVALVGFLRSPWVGVPDAAWLPLWGVQFPQKMGDLHGPDADQLEDLRQAVEEAAGKVPADLPGMEDLSGWSEGLHNAVRVLAELRRSFREEPADVFVDKLQALPLVTETEAARFLASHRLANLDRFFRGVREALDDGEGGPQMVLRALREGVAGERLEEVGPPGDETLDAVRILTIHVSKGLEFDHVYVADLHRKPLVGFRHDEPKVHRHDDCWELSLFGARSLGFHRVEEKVKRVSAAEEIRTLYVATTRAARRLVLAGRWPDPGKDPEELKPGREQAYVEYMQHRAGKRPDLALHLGSVANGGDESKVDAEGVRWRIPRRLPESRRRMPKPPKPPLSLKEARADLERLETAREQAVSRMERPLAAAASQRAHELLREALEEEGGEERPSASRPLAFVDREGAMAVGKAVHRALELLDLGADPATALRRQRQAVEGLVAPLVSAERRDEVVRKVDLVLASLEGSAILRRLVELAPHIVGREVPFLAAGEDDRGPVGASIGTMDLLYRDPDDGALVVADYKTDAVEGEAELEERARAYAAQGEVYVDAVRRFLSDPPEVRFELWFLAADRIVSVPT